MRDRQPWGCILAILITWFLIWFMTSCSSNKSTFKHKNGHPKLYYRNHKTQ